MMTGSDCDTHWEGAMDPSLVQGLNARSAGDNKERRQRHRSPT